MAKRSAKCPQCGNRVELEAQAGEHIACPQCQAHLTVNIHKTSEPDKPAAQADPLIGKTLGEFEIVDLLGRGGMGAVYKARQPSLGRMVAVKVLSKDHSRDAAYVGRFDREARAAAAVSHPSIIEIHSVGADHGHHYIAMELVEGETLGDVLRRDGPVSPDRAVEIMKHVAAALAEAHGAGIVHRDIKPSNILLTPRGGVKVADFGLAKRPDVDVAVTQAGKILGTPLYMPPEVASGEEFEPRSDLYSLGATFYHALAGRPPFEGGTSSQIAIKQVRDEVPPLARIAPDVPAVLARLIHRLLSKAPADRPATAAAVLEALKYIDADMAAARSPSGLGTALPPAQRRVLRKIPTAKKAERPKLLIPGIIAAAVLAIGIGIVLIFVLGGDDQGPKEGEPPSVAKPVVAKPPPKELPPAWQAAWQATTAKADRLVKAQRFGEALAAYEELGKRNDDAQLQQRIRQASGDIRSQADIAWRQARDKAKTLLDSGKLDKRRLAKAQTVLQPVIDQYGIPEYAEAARGMLPKIPPPPPPIWEKPWRKTKTTADGLVKQQRFGDAIKAYEQLGKQHKAPELRDRVGKAIAAIRKSAEAAWLAVEKEARKRLDQKKYNEAVAALKPVLATYAVESLKKKAETLHAQIIAARDTAGRGSEDERLRRLSKRVSDAEKAADKRVSALDLKGAAAALNKVPSAGLPKDLAARLTARRDEIACVAKLKAKMIEQIKKAKPWLQKRSVAVRGPEGVVIRTVGTRVVDADDGGLTVQVTDKDQDKTELRKWQSLSEATVQQFMKLAASDKSADDQLAAGLLALVRKDAATAEKHFEKARKLGVNIDRYLDRLATAAFAKATALLEAKKYTEADAVLTGMEQKYGKTPWSASHKDEFNAVRARVKSAIANVEAEKRYTQAAELFKRGDYFTLKPIVLKLKRDYPKTAAVTDTKRTPSFEEMANAVEKLGKFITVAKRGKADFRTIQAAINAAPPNSLVEIQDSATYAEEIIIPKEKEGLTLRGKRGCWPLIKAPAAVLIVVRSPRTTIQRVLMAGGRTCMRVEAQSIRLRSVIVAACPTGGALIGVTGNTPSYHCEVDSCVVVGAVGSPLGPSEPKQLSARNSFALRGVVLAGNADLHNMFMAGMVRARSAKVQSCTIVGGIRCDKEPLVLRDSIVSHVEAMQGGAQIEYCNVFGKGYLLLAKPGKGCFSGNPMFRDPKTFDYRLKPTSPCRKKASDRGDVGCRYTPEMIEILKKALELRKKGIIKF